MSAPHDEPAREARQANSVIHFCPPYNSGMMPCCGKTPFEVPETDRLSTEFKEATCNLKYLVIERNGATGGVLWDWQLPTVVDEIPDLKERVAGLKDGRLEVKGWFDFSPEEGEPGDTD